MELPEGIILVDKPKGITSFDVIRKLRGELGVRKMGHAGTLDPFATGLLIIGVEKGTKKLSEYLKLSKIYQAEILLGVQTDTGDCTGTIVEEKRIREIPREHLLDMVMSLKGEHELSVPVYSAIKRGGEALYKKVRRGERVDAPLKKMVVHDAHSYDIGAYDERKGQQIAQVEFHVGSGTYIRSLAEELGRRLECPATVKELRRISIGPFDIKDARQL